MSILVNSTTRVITQGMTGKTGAYHTRACRAYANADNFVAGVNPRKAGTDMDGIPIFGTVAEAKNATMRLSSMCRPPELRLRFWKPWKRSLIWLSALRKAFRSWICCVLKAVCANSVARRFCWGPIARA